MHWNYYRYVSIWSYYTTPAFSLQEFYFDLMKCSFRRLFWGLDLIKRYHTSLLLIHIIIIYNKYIYFYVHVLCKYLFKIINHSLLYIESSIFSNQDKIFDIKLKQKWFMSKYDMNKIRFPPVLCGYEVDVS